MTSKALYTARASCDLTLVCAYTVCVFCDCTTRRELVRYDELLRVLSAVSPIPFGRVARMNMSMLSQTPRLCVWSYSTRRKQHARGYGDAVEGTDPASVKARIMLRRLWIGMSALLSSLAPVFGEVSLLWSHSVMAARS